MDDQAVTEKLTAGLMWRIKRVWIGTFGPYEIAAALLPTVREIVADELRAAADGLPGLNRRNPTQDWLLTRADALDGQTP